ncbi:hypothetical protein ACF09C_00570 [Streptomyces sp. NPDC014870]|uniref:hypothetical protein n=1 Tax=Streptomyces sp. NPDC014870 TaxID=3364925 RepID=UPI0036F83867
MALLVAQQNLQSSAVDVAQQHRAFGHELHISGRCAELQFLKCAVGGGQEDAFGPQGQGRAVPGSTGVAEPCGAPDVDRFPASQGGDHLGMAPPAPSRQYPVGDPDGRGQAAHDVGEDFPHR